MAVRRTLTPQDAGSSPASRANVQDVMGHHAWPYGAHDEVTRERLLRWARSRGLQFAPRGGCLHWIVARRCFGWCHDGHRSRMWMDHVTGWTRNGKPAILLCQPYALSELELESVAEVADAWNLSVKLDGCGWYGHGTVAIELSRMTAWPNV